MAKILGLDLGTNSIGWAVVDSEKEKYLYQIKVYIYFLKVYKMKKVLRVLKQPKEQNSEVQDALNLEESYVKLKLQKF